MTTKPPEGVPVWIKDSGEVVNLMGSIADYVPTGLAFTYSQLEAIARAAFDAGRDRSHCYEPGDYYYDSPDEYIASAEFKELIGVE